MFYGASTPPFIPYTFIKFENNLHLGEAVKLTGGEQPVIIRWR